MTLGDGKVGKSYTVKELKVEQQVRRRLESLGLTNKTRIQLMNRNAQGAVIFKVRGTRLAIGSKIAEAIYITEVAK